MSIFANLLLASAAAFVAVLVQRATGGVYEPAPNSMNGQTVLITGGTTGLGLESAKRLAKAGASVIITARSEEKGQEAVKAIQEFGPGDASFKILQLDDLDSTKAAADWDLPTIDVLLLNAGIMALPTRELTTLDLERQIHTNHLGHFVFTASIVPKLSKSARIAVVSSDAHKIVMISGGKLDLEYSWKPSKDSYQGWKSYGMSKLANIYFAAKLDEMSSFTVVSLHPGSVATDLARQLSGNRMIQTLIDRVAYPLGKALGIFLTVEQGANNQVYLASTKDAIVGGGYYSGMKPQTLGDFATDPEVSNQLWKQSEEISGVTFSF